MAEVRVPPEGGGRPRTRQRAALGAGTLKRQWLADPLGPDSLAPQRRLKSVFGPHVILDPGKAM